MKTTLFITALLVAFAAKAQDTPASRTPEQQTKKDTPAQAEVPKDKKKPKKIACSDIPPEQQIFLRLPPEKEAEWARKRAEFQRKTGIYIPPPKPPKPLPPCPPPAAQTDDRARERK